MSDLEIVAELFRIHLENPADPTACIKLIKNPSITAQFFREYFSDGRVNQLGIRDKVHVLGLLGLCFPYEKSSFIDAWIAVESDPKILLVLRKSNEIKSPPRKPSDRTEASEGNP